jgi:hypothetical protein
MPETNRLARRHISKDGKKRWAGIPRAGGKVAPAFIAAMAAHRHASRDSDPPRI